MPSWELFPFATNRTDPLAIVESEHRQHAVVELAIRDLKDQALAHFPSGKFNANAAWTVIACLAHNLLRWTSVLGLPGQTIGSDLPRTNHDASVGVIETLFGWVSGCAAFDAALRQPTAATATATATATA